MSTPESTPTTDIARPIDTHPIPYDQSDINAIWADQHDPALDDPPSVDTAHDEYLDTITQTGAWHVFRARYPFDTPGVVLWHRELGTGLVVTEDCREWHQLVNVFAAVVDAEGDCRDAEIKSSLTQAGSTNQRCRNCGSSWSI